MAPGAGRDGSPSVTRADQGREAVKHLLRTMRKSSAHGNNSPEDLVGGKKRNLTTHICFVKFCTKPALVTADL